MEETRTIVLDIYDYKLIINALNEFRNRKLAENIDTEIIDELIKKCNGNTNKIVHIGDDCINDYVMPRKKGIKASLSKRSITSRNRMRLPATWATRSRSL